MFSSLHIYCSPTVCFSEASLNCVTARRCAARLRPERAFTSAATVMKVDRVHVCERRAAVCKVGIFKDREPFVSSGVQSYFARRPQFGGKKKKNKLLHLCILFCGLGDALLHFLCVKRKVGSRLWYRPVKASAVCRAVVCFSMCETRASEQWFAFPLRCGSEQGNLVLRLPCAEYVGVAW